MPLFFANPLGFLALLGIPVVLFIHFLQRQSRSLTSSTLFLLDAIDRQSLKGQKIDRLRNSLPLWLQLLLVCLLTWLLVQPRWTKENQMHRIAIVLDSSASMTAFQQSVIESLKTELPELTRAGGTTSLTLIESHSEGETLYRGSKVSELLETLDDWSPSSSAHSPETALRVGRSIAGANGSLLFVTDHITEQLAFDASLLSIGEPIENVGFAGVSLDERDDETLWRATVKNYADTPQTRDWFLGANGQRTAARQLTLEPGEARLLSGKFPTGQAKISLLLEPDDFPRDDRLFLVLPKPKSLTIAQSVSTNAQALVADIVDSLENAEFIGANEPDSPADLTIATHDPLQPAALPSSGILFIHQNRVPRNFLSGPVLVENHPLTENLNWQGLIARNTPSIPLTDEDLPLVWQGERPIVSLRSGPAGQRLVFNFDVVTSNAMRLPAFIILINRFANEIRAEKIALSRENVELRQLLDIAVDAGEGSDDLVYTSDEGATTVPLTRAPSLRAPRQPCFFEIRQGDLPLFLGAANFADTREADFSEAGSRSDVETLPQEIAERQTVDDPWWQLWLLGGVALSLVTWFVLGKKESETGEALA